MTDKIDDPNITRRSFLAATIWSIGGVIALSLGIPSIVYIVGPALKRNQAQDEWIRLGSKSKVEIGVPTLFKTTIKRQTGWIINEEELSVYIVTDDGRNYIALSNICTHLGCRVRWIEDKGKFFCPCHNGVFDELGKVVSGPPPRPLDQYETKIVEDQIFIKVG
jgi:menaquinol-cytochrome c reductase iron-sulfur subunit